MDLDVVVDPDPGEAPLSILVLSGRQRIEREGKVSEDDAKRIMAQVCQGLHRAHKQGMIHRDIKPDNILLTHDNVAKVTDLGTLPQVTTGHEKLNVWIEQGGQVLGKNSLSAEDFIVRRSPKTTAAQ